MVAHYAWWMLMVDRESRTVVTFHAEAMWHSPPEAAQARLAKGLPGGEGEAFRACLSECNLATQALKAILNGAERTAEHSVAIDAFYDRCVELEWFPFMDHKWRVRQDRRRPSLEVALWLCGFNPLSRYTPFTTGYAPPPGADSLMGVVRKGLACLDALRESGQLDEQMFCERRQRFFRTYVEPVYSSYRLPSEDWQLFHEFFGLEVIGTAPAS